MTIDIKVINNQVVLHQNNTHICPKKLVADGLPLSDIISKVSATNLTSREIQNNLIQILQSAIKGKRQYYKKKVTDYRWIWTVVIPLFHLFCWGNSAIFGSIRNARKLSAKLDLKKITNHTYDDLSELKDKLISTLPNKYSLYNDLMWMKNKISLRLGYGTSWFLLNLLQYYTTFNCKMAKKDIRSMFESHDQLKKGAAKMLKSFGMDDKVEQACLIIDKVEDTQTLCRNFIEMNLKPKFKDDKIIGKFFADEINNLWKKLSDEIRSGKKTISKAIRELNQFRENIDYLFKPCDKYFPLKGLSNFTSGLCEMLTLIQIVSHSKKYDYFLTRALVRMGNESKSGFESRQQLQAILRSIVQIHRSQKKVTKKQLTKLSKVMYNTLRKFSPLGRSTDIIYRPENLVYGQPNAGFSYPLIEGMNNWPVSWIYRVSYDFATFVPGIFTTSKAFKIRELNEVKDLREILDRPEISALRFVLIGSISCHVYCAVRCDEKMWAILDDSRVSSPMTKDELLQKMPKKGGHACCGRLSNCWVHCN